MRIVIGSCEDAAAHLSEYAEGELRGFRHVRLRLHLSLCQRCSEVLAGLRTTISVLRTLRGPEPDASPELAHAILERIRREG